MDKSEVVIYCVDDILSGRISLEACARQHPELRSEITSDLAVAKGVRELSPDLTPDFKGYARMHLFDEFRPHFHPFADAYAQARTK